MSLFKKEVDTEKELEIVATMYDFMTEAMDEEIDNASQGGTYGEEYAKKSISKKTITLNALSSFDLDQYKNLVDKKLLSSARNVKNALIDELSAWLQQDKIATGGHVNAYEVERSIQKARSAQYQLQSSLRTFKAEMLKSADRYRSAHDGNDPDGDQIEKYSIRKTL